jgi:hypothetical protein
MTEYTFKVEAVNTVHGKAPATEKAVLTNPSKVTGLKIASSTASTATLTWDEVPGATGYELERYSSSKKAYITAARTKGTTGIAKGLWSYTSYQYRVRAYYTKDGVTVYSEYSDVVSGRTKMGQVENL